MCVQGRFCLQRKPRQANPQPFPYPLTGGLGLIKLLSKTRRDEFPSSHLPCHPFNSAEIHSFLFSYVKMGRGEPALRGTCWGRRGGGGGVWVALPGCSVPGTNKGAKPEEMGADRKRASTRTVAVPLWLGPPLWFFFLFASLLDLNKNMMLKKGKKRSMHVAVYLFQRNACFLPHISPYLPPVNEEA